MRWTAQKGKYISSSRGHHYLRLEDGTEIEVDPDVYQKQFQEYLLSRGLKPTTYQEIMQKAEQEWHAFCQLLDTFDENGEQWLELQRKGVWIKHPHS